MTDEKRPVTIVPPRIYDFLKPTTQVLLPGASALVLGLGQVWDFDTKKIIATLVLTNVFLGVLITFSSLVYKRTDGGIDGYVDFEPETEESAKRMKLSFRQDKDAENFDQQRRVVLKVRNPVKKPQKRPKPSA